MDSIIAPHGQLKNELWEELRSLTEVTAVLDFVHKIDEIEKLPEPVMLRSDLMWLRRGALERTQKMTVDDHEQATDLILDIFIPHCLNTNVKPEGDAMISVEHEYLRERLGKWIASYEQPKREVLRSSVIQRLCEVLSENDVSSSIAACRTIGAIGYRGQLVEATLYSLLDRNDELGDVALSTLVGLGIPSDKRELLQSKAIVRAAIRPSSSLAYPIQELAGPRVLKIAFGLYIPEKEEEGLFATSRLPWGYSVLSRFADILWQNDNIQDVIWSQLWNADLNDTERKRHILDSSEIGGRCNAVRVIGDLLSLLPEDESGFEQYIIQRRVLECVRPNHMHGWLIVKASQILRTVLANAVRNSQQEVNFSTPEMDRKQDAWKVLLCLGITPSISYLDQAVRDEVNYYVRGRVLSSASFVKYEKLPDAVLDIFSGEVDVSIKSGDAGARISAVKGAEDLAVSVSTLESLQAVLNHGYTFNGETLLSSGMAAGEISKALIRAGNSEVLNALSAAVGPNRPIRMRIVAMSAIRALALANLLTEDLCPLLIELGSDEGLPSHLKSYAVEALGHLPKSGSVSDIERANDFVLTVFTREFGRSIAPANDVEDFDHFETVRWKVLEAMIRRGVWRSSKKEFLHILGLEVLDNDLRITEPEKYAKQNAFLLGLLGSRNLGEFDSALHQIIEFGNREATYLVLHLITDENSEDRDRLSAVLPDIIVRRAFRVSTGYSSEPYLFEVLAHLSSPCLYRTAWYESWSNWMPNVRAALASALRASIPVSQDDINHEISLLRRLVNDGTYGVRRAAYRTFSEKYPKALRAQFLSWIIDTNTANLTSIVSDREKAAEAAGWISDERITLTEYDNQLEGRPLDLLASDREAGVREVANRISMERRDRHWADTYFEKLKEGLDEHNHDVASVYRFGNALEKVGDDGHKLALQRLSHEKGIPPHVRLWLEHICNEIDKRWRKVTEKWPEPWLSWDGFVEEQDGVIKSEGKEYSAHFSLHYFPSAEQTFRSYWKGIFWLHEDIGLTGVSLGAAEIKIPNRASRRILVTHITSDGFNVLVGNDYYPE